MRCVTLALAAPLVLACQEIPRSTAPDTRLPAEKAAPQSGYQQIVLSLPQGVASRAVAINKHDQAAGTVFFRDSSRAFLWDNGTVENVAVPGARTVVATDINDRGQVVGWSSPTDEREAHAFVWDNATVQDLGPVVVFGGRGPEFHQVRINDRGQVLGHRPSPTSPLFPGPPFLWENGVTRDVPLEFAAALDDQGDVVGWVRIDSAGIRWRRAALWDGGAVTLLGTLGGALSWALAISPTGWVAGGSTTATGTHAFRWRAGQMEDLGQSGEFSSGRPVGWEGQFVDDQGRVEGQTDEDIFLHWDHGATQPVPCLCNVHVLDMNRFGLLTGSRGWVWDGGSLSFLEGDTFSSAWGIAINDRGVVAGVSSQPSGNVATVWIPPHP